VGSVLQGIGARPVGRAPAAQAEHFRRPLLKWVTTLRLDTWMAQPQCSHTTPFPVAEWSMRAVLVFVMG
jgi:hypothetical protein